MSAVAASSAKDEEEMQSWVEEIMNTVKGGGDLSIDSLKSFIMYMLHSNKKTVNAILQFKEDILKGTSKKMKNNNKKKFDILGDEYMKISSQMLDFLSEMENFLMLARNSHSYVGNAVQQYFQMETDMRGNAHYRKISEKLKKLKGSEDNIYEHSAESLLQKAVSLKTQHEEMLQKLSVETDKLAKKEKGARNWKNITYMIFSGALVSLVIVGIVTACIAVPPFALILAGHCIGFVFQKSEKQYKNMREANELKGDETRVAIRELGDIKSSIDGVIIRIDSLLYTPNCEMDQEQIDFTMKEIEGKMRTFLNKIEDLEKDVEKCKKEIRKARSHVLI